MGDEKAVKSLEKEKYENMDKSDRKAKSDEILESLFNDVKNSLEVN